MSRIRKSPPAPEGVQLLWKASDQKIDVQHAVTYVGMDGEGIATFVVPVTQEQFDAWRKGQLDLLMDMLPAKTQLGMVPMGTPLELPVRPPV